MKNALIYGYGVTGKGAHKLLNKKGFDVTIYDDKESIEKVDLKKYDFIIKSPGIPENKPLIRKADELGVKIISEIELAYINSNYKIIAITGTNGKTTITTKLKELLRKLGYRVEAAGNIGKTFSEVVCENADLDIVVLELSSYQLERIERFKPNISIITNLSPDHMNRYDNLYDYYNTKFNILKNTDENDWFIINKDDKNIVEILKGKNYNCKKMSISTRERADIQEKNGEIFIENEFLMNSNELSLEGKPNLENSLFILAVAKILKSNIDRVKEFLENCSSLEHRMEKFFVYKNSLFINDSKGTNDDSTIKALKGFNEKVILICGGKDKKLDLNNLADEIIKSVKEIYLIGETAENIEKLLLERNFDGNIYNLKKIEKVVDILYSNLAKSKETILFSPAASSFDQFENYEERGKIFKTLILNKFGGID